MTMSDASWWQGSAASTPPASYPIAPRCSQYLLLKDGTRLAADLFLPSGIGEERVPTVISLTPYVRGMDFRFRFAERLLAWLGLEQEEWGPAFAQYGYAFMAVEIRGAGASFGTKTSIFHDQVAQDGGEVLDWIIAQPWSNGAVGATGISALGLTSMFLATGRHPALKAIAPRFTVFDVFHSVHPGGLLTNRFLTDIGANLRAMDSNRLADAIKPAVARYLMRMLVRGLRGVDEDKSGSLLAAAVRDHAENEGFDRDIAAVRYRDDQLPHSRIEATLDTQSPHTLADALRASGVPIYAYGGWFDGAFQRDMIHLYLNATNAGSRLTIGPWAHGARCYSSPVIKGKRKPDFDQGAELVRFFDLHLKDIDRGVSEEASVHYFTMVEEQWKEATSWPPPGTQLLTYHLAAQNRLLAEPETSALDRYQVDRSATTGAWSRYGKHLTGGFGPAHYPHRKAMDRKLLVYNSSPLERDIEVTGHPLVVLTLCCDTPDGAIFVYLEDVAPNGHPLVVTDACLRLSQRSVPTTVPYQHLGIWRSGRRTDLQSVVPGQRMQIELDLLPTSWLFQAGHTIRLAIAGADADNFVMVPESASAPTFTFEHGGEQTARIDLPIVPSEPLAAT